MTFKPSCNTYFPLRMINCVSRYIDAGGRIHTDNRIVVQLSKLQVLDYFFPGVFIKETAEADEAEYDYASSLIKAPRRYGILSNCGASRQKITEISDCLLGNKKGDQGYRNYNAAHNMLRRAAALMASEPSVFTSVISNLHEIYTVSLNSSQQSQLDSWMDELIAQCADEKTIGTCTSERADGLSFDRDVYDSLIRRLSGYIQSKDYAACWTWLCLGSMLGNYISNLLQSHENNDDPSVIKLSAESFQLVSSPLPVVRPGFYGRDEYLSQIDAMFSQGSRVVFLYGIEGIGKSEIAAQYALSRHEQYDTIIHAEYEGSLEKLITAEMPFQIRPALSLSHDESSFRAKMDLIKQISGRKTLIILDHFNTPRDEDLNDFLNARYRVLVTTDFDYSSRYASLKVREIEDENALINLFMNNYQGYAVEPDDPDLIRLIRLSGSHTYTIVLLARHMENSGQSVKEMIDALNRNGIGALSETVTDDAGRADRASAFLTELFRMSELNEEEQSVLRHLSSYWPAAAEPMDFRQQADLSSFKSILALEKRGWIIRTAEGISLHPLIFRIIQYLYPAEDNN